MLIVNAKKQEREENFNCKVITCEQKFTLNFLVIQLTELYLYLSLITEKQFMCNSIRRNL